MKKLVSVGVVAFAVAAFLAPNAKADTVEGQCNSIVAKALGAGQACWDSDCEVDQCNQVGGALLEFFSDPACAEAYANGELDGLPGNAIIQPAGPDATGAKHLQDVICGSIVNCGFCAGALAAGICPLYCM